jgi:hypothetical protein
MVFGKGKTMATVKDQCLKAEEERLINTGSMGLKLLCTFC